MFSARVCARGPNVDPATGLRGAEALPLGQLRFPSNMQQETSCLLMSVHSSQAEAEAEAEAETGLSGGWPSEPRHGLPCNTLRRRRILCLLQRTVLKALTSQIELLH
jgi:hypothetical protein